MTERSRPWDGSTTGDATESPYDAGTEWARLFRALLPAAEQSANKGGVMFNASGFSDYNASTPSANTTRIASGIGWNQGTWHESDANVDIAIPTPSTGTRIDRIVLRKSWVGQTVRLTRVAGTEGAGAPALTQSFGVTWDVPLWNVSITTGGVITYSDQRPFLLVPQHTHADTTGGGTVPHTGLSSVTADQHHAQLHAASHAAAGGDPVSHTALSNIGTNTHATLDTHIATNIGAPAGPHNIVRFNTTGSNSLGAPTDGKLAFCRANGGTLTMTTPSGAIFIGTTNSGASLAVVNGDAVTLIADGTNWYVF